MILLEMLEIPSSSFRVMFSIKDQARRQELVTRIYSSLSDSQVYSSFSISDEHNQLYNVSVKLKEYLLGFINTNNKEW